MQRILILRFSSLGDVVLLSTLLDGIVSQSPGAEIWLVTKAQFGSLYREDPRVTRTLTLDAEHGLRDLARELDSVPFDLILDAHGSLRSHLLRASLPPAPTRTIAKDAVARWLFAKARIRSRALLRRQVDRYRALLGPDPPQWRPRIIPSERHRAEADRLVPRPHALAVAPGARHPTKRWSEERFTQTAAHVRDQGVLVVGAAHERDLCERVATALGPDATVLTGLDDLGVLAAVLARCRLLLCNDSGLMHLAEAVETPVLSVFGPTSREFGFFPLDPRSRVIEHALPCRPCSRTGSTPCRMPEQWCLSRSTSALVTSQLEVQWQRLSATSTSPPS